MSVMVHVSVGDIDRSCITTITPALEACVTDMTLRWHLHRLWTCHTCWWYKGYPSM